MGEEQLLKKIEEYKALAKENKNIDLAALLIQSLEDHQRDVLPQNQKRWAYLGSLFLPPLGLVFAVYFWFSGKDDAKQAAFMCVGLTVFSMVLTVLFFKAVLNTAGVNMRQIEQINPGQIKELLQ